MLDVVENAALSPTNTKTLTNSANSVSSKLIRFWVGGCRSIINAFRMNTGLMSHSSIWILYFSNNEYSVGRVTPNNFAALEMLFRE